MEKYTGYQELILTDEQLGDFYSYGKLPSTFHENEYVFLKDSTEKILDIYCYQNGTFRKVQYPTIENEYAGMIKPRNPGQIIAMDMLKDPTSKVKLVRGVYGSGKDYLMLNQALEDLKSEKFDKIVYIRPNVTVANVPDIGFLKGDVDDKLNWTLAPFLDKVGGQDGLDYLVRTGQIESVPLLFIRGRSFEKSLIYVCEGQNITSEIAKLIISRVGEGSELWINGDTHQTDKKVYEQDNGIVKMIDKLTGHPLFGYVYLSKTQRGEVADLANLLDE